MTIALIAPDPAAATKYRLGQGFRIAGTISGPTAVDCVLYATLSGVLTGRSAAYGKFNLLGANAFDFFLDEAIDLNYGLAPEAAATLFLDARDGAGVSFDTVLYTNAFIHDPVSGLGGLVVRKVGRTYWSPSS